MQPSRIAVVILFILKGIDESWLKTLWAKLIGMHLDTAEGTSLLYCSVETLAVALQESFSPHTHFPSWIWGWHYKCTKLIKSEVFSSAIACIWWAHEINVYIPIWGKPHHYMFDYKQEAKLTLSSSCHGLWLSEADTNGTLLPRAVTRVEPEGHLPQRSAKWGCMSAPDSTLVR